MGRDGFDSFPSIHDSSCQERSQVTVITRSGAGELPSQTGVKVIEVGWAKIPMEFTRSYGKRQLSS